MGVKVGPEASSTCSGPNHALHVLTSLYLHVLTSVDFIYSVLPFSCVIAARIVIVILNPFLWGQYQGTDVCVAHLPVLASKNVQEKISLTCPPWQIDLKCALRRSVLLVSSDFVGPAKRVSNLPFMTKSFEYLMNI